MSVDLAYVVQPDGQLTASNKIVLRQLAFGDKVEGSEASLPVKLATALLADRNGVINVDLPVSGSINDPEFSLGGLIWKAIGNLIVKVVSAPFNLIASAFGGEAASFADRLRTRRGDARRSGAREPGQGRQGARRSAGADAHDHRREPTRPRERRLEKGAPGADRAIREAPPGDRRGCQRVRRGDRRCDRIPHAAEGGLPARRHRQAEERRRPDEGSAGRRRWKPCCSPT